MIPPVPPPPDNVTVGAVLYPVPARVTVAPVIVPLASTLTVPVDCCLVVRPRLRVVMLLNSLSISSISSSPVSNLSAPCS